jgi:hypothetical protein
MSITVTHEDDGTITVKCGDQSITVHLDGRPVTTKQPIILKEFYGNGAGHLALDIPLRGQHQNNDGGVQLLPGESRDLDDLVGELEPELERET